MTINHTELHEENFRKTVFGFWTYLMTDCVLFGMLFATFAVLRDATFGGPVGRDIFDLNFMLVETFVLLTSSFLCGISGLEAMRNRKWGVQLALIATLLLGLTFVGMEIYEFSDLLAEGNSWSRSAFLSSYFTLVGTHGFHVTIGSLWMIVMLFQVQFKGLTWIVQKRLTCLRLFWHFLDVVWIFIFTFVYLLGYL